MSIFDCLQQPTGMGALPPVACGASPRSCLGQMKEVV